MAFEFLNEQQVRQIEYLREMYQNEVNVTERKKFRFGIVSYLSGLQDAGAITGSEYKILYDYCLLA